jgi:hypothetical protein
MVQTFTDQQDTGGQYHIIVDEDSLASRIGFIIRTFQCQQDRIGDMADAKKKIAKGE